MSIDQDIAYEEKIKQRLKNYIEYYENPECRKKEGMKDPLSLEELNMLSIQELLDIMPHNTCIEEYSEAFKCHITKHIVSFKMHKTIDGGWILEYSEGHRDKPLKDQYTLFELRCKDLKLGLIDIFLQKQNNNREWWNGVRSGRIVLSLGESWDDRESLGLPLNI